MPDPVDSPAHYFMPGGFEIIEITRHLNYPLGSAVKYVVRCDHKGNPIEDLRKAIRCIEIEIETRERAAK